MIICFCTSKSEDDVNALIKETVSEGAVFSDELVKNIHRKLNGGDETMGRCFGCYDEVEGLVFDYIRNKK